VGALVARVLGVATVGAVSAFGGARVAAFWAYIGRARAKRGLIVVRVVRPVGGVRSCWAGRDWVGLVPLI
jgi:hypothetical protein